MLTASAVLLSASTRSSATTAANAMGSRHYPNPGSGRLEQWPPSLTLEQWPPSGRLLSIAERAC